MQDKYLTFPCCFDAPFFDKRKRLSKALIMQFYWAEQIIDVANLMAYGGFCVIIENIKQLDYSHARIPV